MKNVALTLIIFLPTVSLSQVGIGTTLPTEELHIA